MPVIYRIGPECRMCLTVGILIAGLVSGGIFWVASAAGLNPVASGIVMLVLSAGVIWILDQFCRRRYAPAAEPVEAPYHGAAPAAAAAEGVPDSVVSQRSAFSAGTEERSAAAAAATAGRRPAMLDGPRDGRPDDLKKIKGIGPKLEQLCHSLGIWHFDQIAEWTPEEVAWVDGHLGEFRGRVARDDWIGQARALAGGAGAGTTASGAPRA